MLPPLIVTAMLSSCTSSGVLPGAGWTAIHYDRNRDGRVDYTIYDQPDIMDEEWALRDTDFDGRYDVRYNVGWGLRLLRVDRPVPTGVPMTPGPPPGGACR